jgi:four helix bundle protein
MLHVRRMQDFRRFRVWQAAHKLTLDIYRVTRAFPADERFGLVSQLRQAASSIQANIAEACGRGTRADTARIVQLSIGSATEVSNHLILSRDLEYIDGEKYADLEDRTDRIRAMLVRLVLKLRAHGPRP